MKKFFKRFSAAVLSLAVALTAVVFDVPGKISAAAATEEAAESHNCEGDHDGWTEWADSLFPTTSGRYFLTADIDYGVRTIGSGVDITICLNGHKISKTGGSVKHIITIDGGSLTLCDCQGGGVLTGGYFDDSHVFEFGAAVYVKGGGSFTLNGGTISGNRSVQKGGAVGVNNGSFIMNGGSISNNTASEDGGGVYLYGEKSKFIMNGGTISGNKSDNTSYGGGGAVYLSSKASFTMNGGEISDNGACKWGGGVYIYGSVFTMNGGEISNNTSGTGNSGSGGGVYVHHNATFNMNGGTISGNTAGTSWDGNGGGVSLSVDTSKFTMSGGTISGNTATKNGGGIYNEGQFIINGKVEIKDNINDNRGSTSANNVYLGNEKTITIGENFSADSPIGVTTYTTPKNCKNVVDVTSSCSTDISSSFTADLSGKIIVFDGEKVQLTAPHKNPPTHTEGKDADCEEGGNVEYWQCPTCEKTFEDAAYTTPITDPVIEATGHDWGEWEITTPPTINTEGEAKHTCKNDSAHTETETVLMLTDTDVWEKTVNTDPTIDEVGSYTYISDYGTVTVDDVPKLTDDPWKKTETTKPTIDTNGEYTYTSVYGTVTADVPKLTDPVWTKDDTQHVDPTEESTGKDVYTSDYGEVEVTLDKLPHTHVWGEWTITTPPAETETGTAERSCTKDSEHKDIIELPALSDTTVWTKDDIKHVDPTEESTGKDVYTSEYGEVTVTLPKEEHTHTLTYVPEVPATETTEGVKEHWHCEDCGKDFADENGKNEETSDTLILGKIQTEVKSGENAPKAELTTPKDELVSAVLTPEEQAVINTGEDIRIILTIEDASDKAPAEDKTAVESEISKLTDYTLGQYIDVNLLIKIGNKEQKKITETKKPIKVTLEIPAELLGSGNTYSVIRVHNGETTVLPDLDDDENTVTIETDRFSTYALVYSENRTTPAESGGSSDNNTTSESDDNSSSNENSTDSGNNTSSPDDNNFTPNESGPTDNNENPSTGVAVSLVPFALAVTFLAVAVKRKEK